MNYRLAENFRKVETLLRRNGHRGRRGNEPVTQNRILKILEMNDGLSQREIAYLLAIRPQSAGELISKMEASELVIRKTDGNDTRINNIFLTEKGRESAAQISFDSPRKGIFSCLNEEEIETLNAILEKVLENNPVSEKEMRHPEDRGMAFAAPRMEVRIVDERKHETRQQENADQHCVRPERRHFPRPRMGVYRGRQEAERHLQERGLRSRFDGREGLRRAPGMEARRMPFSFEERAAMHRRGRDAHPFVDDRRADDQDEFTPRRRKF